MPAAIRLNDVGSGTVAAMDHVPEALAGGNVREIGVSATISVSDPRLCDVNENWANGIPMIADHSLLSPAHPTRNISKTSATSGAEVAQAPMTDGEFAEDVKSNEIPFQITENDENAGPAGSYKNVPDVGAGAPGVPDERTKFMLYSVGAACAWTAARKVTLVTRAPRELKSLFVFITILQHVQTPSGPPFQAACLRRRVPQRAKRPPPKSARLMGSGTCASAKESS